MNPIPQLASSTVSTPVLLPRRGASRGEMDNLNRQFESWAVERFGPRLALTASFADTLLIDIAVGVDPDIEVVFLDTGFHFSDRFAEGCTLHPAGGFVTESHGVEQAGWPTEIRPLDRAKPDLRRLAKAYIAHALAGC